MKALPENDVRRARILHALNRIVDIFQTGSETEQRCREILDIELKKKSSASDMKTRAVGHSHIDTAWLWPIEETIRKCARTFATQLALLERYPEYVFGASAAQHYVFVRDHYPALYSKIKAKIAENRWEIQGGMWVEADCNLIGGESMVRQLLYGKTFFMREFDVDVRNLWLPDVFGYSAAMPQILKKSGIDVMMTQKLSWNQFNRFPFHSFIWRGIDGSEVCVHCPPENTYNSNLRPESLIFSRENFEEKAVLDEFLTLYGIGDGGSGPTEEMIETGLRLRDCEGCPRVEFGPAQEMFDRLVDQKDRLKRWIGELYLEIHRGTYTTQGFIKKKNREFEHKLRELELLYSLIPTEYPAEELERLWKEILLFQFHDIIPGSSIHVVYDECRQKYEELQNRVEILFGRLSESLFTPDPDVLCLVNTLSYRYERPVSLPETWRGHRIVDENGQDVAVQDRPEGPIALVKIPALGEKTLRCGEKTDIVPVPLPDDPILENDLVRYEFAKDGTIKRAFDKASRREVLLDSKANILSLYEDRPVLFDAWDIDITYEHQHLEDAHLRDMKWIAAGALVQEIHLSFEIGSSSIQQTVKLAANSKRLEFDTTVDWRERHKMLRVAFPVDVHNDTASYEIQFGVIKRPTHRNTSWDMARFEVAAHRFADLSEPGYGVAVMTDCKYGYKILDSTIDLNLLRSPTNPDPEADRGIHRLTYCLLPHEGALEYSCVFSEAAQLNQRPAMFQGRMRDSCSFPCTLDTDSVVLEAVKKAENESAMVVRLYEPRGCRAETKIKLNDRFRVFETDLLERVGVELPTKDDSLTLNFRPFEIKTLLLRK